MFMERFRQELNDVGIAVVDNEEAIANNKTKNRPLIHLCSRFHSLDQVLMRMLKESDNLYAESVLYQIAAAGGIKNATATHARQWIHKLITRIGLNPGDYKFADGSGLSLYTMSPQSSWSACCAMPITTRISSATSIPPCPSLVSTVLWRNA